MQVATMYWYKHNFSLCFIVYLERMEIIWLLLRLSLFEMYSHLDPCQVVTIYLYEHNCSFGLMIYLERMEVVWLIIRHSLLK